MLLGRDASKLRAASVETGPGVSWRECDVVAAVRYLASEEASYVTGQVLHVNGGWWFGA